MRSFTCVDESPVGWQFRNYHTSNFLSFMQFPETSEFYLKISISFHGERLEQTSLSDYTSWNDFQLISATLDS